MIYSLPTGFDASSLQCNMGGMGILVFCCTIQRVVGSVSNRKNQLKGGPTVADRSNFRTSRQFRRPCELERQFCDDTFPVVSAEYEYSVEAAFLSLI
jgi:hypothetical protein